uniref:Metaxin n=1 Tax=Riptortus pedestris TaxID=329032 RepID=R4WIF9_RIPPE|nr:metaxin [Riptortus pedestris]
MAISQPIIIEVWKGDWGLPSIDLECLKTLALIRFSGTEYVVKKTNNPFWTPKGTLPLVHCGKHRYSNFEEVAAYLKIKNVCPDHGLTTVQDAECIAYMNMLEEKLLPALQYVWWVDEKNYLSLTRRWYSRALPFPLNFYYPPKYLKEAQQMIEALHGAENKSDIENKIYNEAEKCLTALSVRLGESEFMFGSHPTSLDAIVFAYLAPLLKAPFKNAVLQNHLKACTNLYKFVTRVSQRYFMTDYQEYENKIKAEAMSNQQTENDKDYPSSIIAALLAIFAMVGYAFSVGIVQVSVESEVDPKINT